MGPRNSRSTQPTDQPKPLGNDWDGRSKPAQTPEAMRRIRMIAAALLAVGTLTLQAFVLIAAAAGVIILGGAASGWMLRRRRTTV